MSAYIVGNDLIDLIVSAGLTGDGAHTRGIVVYHSGIPFTFPDTQLGGDELCAVLRQANYDSVNYRYNDNWEAGDDTAPFRKVHHIGGALIPWGHVLRALDCYEYQSCEHPEYGRSFAHSIVEFVRKRVCARVAEQSDAPWEWSREDVAKREAEIKAQILEQIRS